MIMWLGRLTTRLGGAFANFPSGTITFLKIEFMAIRSCDSTPLTFHYGQQPRNTNVTKDGNTILGGDQDGKISAQFRYNTFVPYVKR